MFQRRLFCPADGSSMLRVYVATGSTSVSNPHKKGSALIEQQDDTLGEQQRQQRTCPTLERS